MGMVFYLVHQCSRSGAITSVLIIVAINEVVLQERVIHRAEGFFKGRCLGSKETYALLSKEDSFVLLPKDYRRFRKLINPNKIFVITLINEICFQRILLMNGVYGDFCSILFRKTIVLHRRMCNVSRYSVLKIDARKTRELVG